MHPFGAQLAVQLRARFGWRPVRTQLDEREGAVLARANGFGNLLIAAGVGAVIGATVGDGRGAGEWTGFPALRFSMAEMLAILALVLGGSVRGLAWYEADPPERE